MEMGEYRAMDVLEDRMWWYSALHTRLLDQLANVQGSVLDVGCGTGGFLVKLRKHRPELHAFGCELVESAASRAARKSGACVVRGTIVALPFASMSFDAVVAADVLCHAGVEPRFALAELARVLRPGGCLVVNMPAFKWLLSVHDKRVHNVCRVTSRSLRSMLAAGGFCEIQATYWNWLLLPLMIVHRKLWRQRQDGASDVRFFPDWLNTALCGILAAERFLPLSAPAGGSVMARALRPFA